MIKPDRLRQLLTESIPYFARNPDQLQLFYSRGNIYATGAKSLSFEYRYSLEILVTDFPSHPDLLFVPVMAFVKEQQSELIYNPDNQQKITFEIEPNNHQSHDIYIQIPLTERVIVRQEADSYQVHHADEPQMTDLQPLAGLEVFINGEKVFERTATAETET